MARNGHYATMYRAWEEAVEADIASPTRKLAELAEKLV
jgi:hypothetical protein